MGLGYNIGNTFDCIGSYITAATPEDYQRGWGNDPVTKHYIDKVKEAGFKTIRLPVSWAQWLDGNNQVDPAYMAAVKEVVDWCMEDDFYVILNIHHDGGEADTSWIRNAASDYAGTLEKYKTIWGQIADTFAGYGDHLIFGSMNEVCFPSLGMSRQYEILNGMNQAFVDTVRGKGGNNAGRHLLIAGYNTDIQKTCDQRYHMPADPAGRCFLSIHYYSPSPFCVATHDVDWCVPETTWGTEEDLAQVRADFDRLAERFLSKGVPVIIGEYGVLTDDNKDVNSIRAYVQKIPEIVMEYGMCPVLWDSGSSGDMKYIERASGEFYDSAIRANYRDLAARAAAGQIGRRDFSYLQFEEVNVPVSPDGWVSIAEYAPEKLRGVRFGISCSSGWDSYGGGGIYIDGWDNMGSWQFNSIYDPVTYIFTDAERARLKDQLGIQIHWTDTSQGGSHREELSITGNQATLLYEKGTEITNAGPGGQTAGSASGGAGGGSGSGGSSGGGGGNTSGRPNNSSTAQDNEGKGEQGNYRFKVNKDDKDKASEKEYRFNDFLSAGEAGRFEPGDTIEFKLRLKSAGGFNGAVVETPAWKEIGSFSNGEGTVYSWTVKPDSDTFGVKFYYIGGEYILWDAEVKIVKKADKADVSAIVFEEQEETDDSGAVVKTAVATIPADEIYSAYHLERGRRVRLTVSLEMLAEKASVQAMAKGMGARETGVKGTVSFTDENGCEIRGEFDDTQKAILIGTPDTDLTVKLTGVKPEEVALENVRMEALPDAAVFAEFEKTGTVVFSEEAIKAASDAKEIGEKAGVKVYIDGDVSDLSKVANNNHLIANGGWPDNEVKKDADGVFVWQELAAGESVRSVEFRCFYPGGENLTVRKLVIVEAEQGAEETPEPELKENERFAELLEDGSYRIPEIDGKTPVSIRFESGSWSDSVNGYGMNVSAGDGTYVGWLGHGDSLDLTGVSAEAMAALKNSGAQLVMGEKEDGSPFEKPEKLWVIVAYGDAEEEPGDNPGEEEPGVQEPELGPDERFAELQADGSYRIPEAAGEEPVSIRFESGSWSDSANGYGMNVSAGDGTYIGWLGHGDSLDLTQAGADAMAALKSSGAQLVMGEKEDGSPFEKPEKLWVIVKYAEVSEEPEPQEPELKENEKLGTLQSDGSFKTPEADGKTLTGVRFESGSWSDDVNGWGMNMSAADGTYIGYISHNGTLDLTDAQAAALENSGAATLAMGEKGDGSSFEKPETVWLIFIYETDADAGPALGADEELAEKQSDGSFKVPQVAGKVPVSVRFESEEWSGDTDGWGMNMSTLDGTYIGYVGLNSSLDFSGDPDKIAAVQNSGFVKLDENKPEFWLIFTYADDETQTADLPEDEEMQVPEAPGEQEEAPDDETAGGQNGAPDADAPDEPKEDSDSQAPDRTETTDKGQDTGELEDGGVNEETQDELLEDPAGTDAEKPEKEPGGADTEVTEQDPAGEETEETEKEPGGEDTKEPEQEPDGADAEETEKEPGGAEETEQEPGETGAEETEKELGGADDGKQDDDSQQQLPEDAEESGDALQEKDEQAPPEAEDSKEPAFKEEDAEDEEQKPDPDAALPEKEKSEPLILAIPKKSKPDAKGEETEE